MFTNCIRQQAHCCAVLVTNSKKQWGHGSQEDGCSLSCCSRRLVCVPGIQGCIAKEIQQLEAERRGHDAEHDAEHARRAEDDRQMMEQQAAIARAHHEVKWRLVIYIVHGSMTATSQYNRMTSACAGLVRVVHSSLCGVILMLSNRRAYNVGIHSLGIMLHLVDLCLAIVGVTDVSHLLVQGSAAAADVEQAVIDFVKGMTVQHRQDLLSRLQAADVAYDATGDAEMEDVFTTDELSDSEQALILRQQRPDILLKKSSITSLKEYITRISADRARERLGKVWALNVEQCRAVILCHWGKEFGPGDLQVSH